MKRPLPSCPRSRTKTQRPRAHPALRAILDEYREKVDEDELEATDALGELDAPDLSE